MIMVKYIVKRLLMVIPVVLGVMVIVFFFQSVSNDDPALQALGLVPPWRIGRNGGKSMG